MKQWYKDTKFRREALLLINKMNDILEEYRADGYVLTVRQLYYQLVARGEIPNTEASYKRITEMVNNARMMGLMDWDMIEDRTRSFLRQTRWSSAAQILQSAAGGFHMDMWVNQNYRVFAIVEKEALAGVLERACREYDVPLLAARGYPSSSVLREFVELDIKNALDDGQEVVIFHLGDHDPSGIDMSRDLEERIHLFTEEDTDRVFLQRIALSMEQVHAENPPPNPAKSTDSRFKDYRKKFGTQSWELDALPPKYLNNLLTEHIKGLIDMNEWTARRQEIETDRARIYDAATHLKRKDA